MSVETSGPYVERRLYMDIIHMESEQNRNRVVVLARQVIHRLAEDSL